MTNRDFIAGVLVIAGLIVIKMGLGLRFTGASNGKQPFAHQWPVEFKQTFVQSCIGNRVSNPDVVNLCQCLTSSLERAQVIDLNKNTFIDENKHNAYAATIQKYMSGPEGMNLTTNCMNLIAQQKAPAQKRNTASSK